MRDLSHSAGEATQTGTATLMPRGGTQQSPSRPKDMFSQAGLVVAASPWPTLEQVRQLSQSLEQEASRRVSHTFGRQTQPSHVTVPALSVLPQAALPPWLILERIPLHLQELSLSPVQAQEEVSARQLALLLVVPARSISHLPRQALQLSLVAMVEIP